MVQPQRKDEGGRRRRGVAGGDKQKTNSLIATQMKSSHTEANATQVRTSLPTHIQYPYICTVVIALQVFYACNKKRLVKGFYDISTYVLSNV